MRAWTTLVEMKLGRVPAFLYDDAKQPYATLEEKIKTSLELIDGLYGNCLVQLGKNYEALQVGRVALTPRLSNFTPNLTNTDVCIHPLTAGFRNCDRDEPSGDEIELAMYTGRLNHPSEH